jgi:hypothetical protein
MKTLAGTIAYRNPEGAAEFLSRHNVKASKNPAQNEMFINMVLARTKSDDVLDDLLEQHPDRDAFGGGSMQREVPKPPTSVKHHNCCGSNFDGDSYNCDGCQGKCGGPPKAAHFAADGSGATPGQPVVQNGVNQTMVMGILGVIAIMGLVILATRGKA